MVRSLQSCNFMDESSIGIKWENLFKHFKLPKNTDVREQTCREEILIKSCNKNGLAIGLKWLKRFGCSSCLFLKVWSSTSSALNSCENQEKKSGCQQWELNGNIKISLQISLLFYIACSSLTCDNSPNPSTCCAFRFCFCERTNFKIAYIYVRVYTHASAYTYTYTYTCTCTYTYTYTFVHVMYRYESHYKGSTEGMLITNSFDWAPEIHVWKFADWCQGRVCWHVVIYCLLLIFGS